MAASLLAQVHSVSRRIKTSKNQSQKPMAEHHRQDITGTTSKDVEQGTT
jgi:hypothetical protein